MAGSYNRVILIGNLGKDPEVRSTQSGGKIVNMTLATSEDWTDKASGERKSKTEWHRIVCFNDRTSDVAERFLKKGAKVCIEGALQTREYTDQSGVKKYTTEVVIGKFNGQLTMLDSKASAPNDTTAENPRTQPAPRAATPRAAPERAATDDLSDEIPF